MFNCSRDSNKWSKRKEIDVRIEVASVLFLFPFRSKIDVIAHWIDTTAVLPPICPGNGTVPEVETSLPLSSSGRFSANRNGIVLIREMPL